MKFKVSTSERGILVTLHDRVDATVAPEFKALMGQVLAGDDTIIVIDMAAVEFIDSSGLGILVAAHKALSGKRRLVLAAVPAHVAQILKLTGTADIFNQADSAEAAFEA